MKKENCFYSVFHNEDAFPFVSDNLLIIADGLGGAGSSLHTLKPKLNENLHDKIIKSAFGDFEEEKLNEMKEYLDYLVADIADGKPHTSALWSSRIVIARCAYALSYLQDFANADLSNENVRKSLVDFILLGLHKTAEHFGLEKGRISGHLLLPTTLAFMKHSTEDNGDIVAEVLWAGDSRCFVLTKDGMKQLSTDDEDKSGAITNLFTADKDRKPTYLNYKKFKIQSPCLLFSVSDGIFDPFEPYNLGVEYHILSKVNETDSYEGWMSLLENLFDQVHQDDATMAIAPIGFTDYEDFKKTMAERIEFITSTWDEYIRMKSMLSLLEQDENSVRGYVESRTKDKINSVLPKLASLIASNSDDIACTSEIKEKIEEEKKTVIQAREKAEDERIKNVIIELREAYKKDPNRKIEFVKQYKNELKKQEDSIKASFKKFKETKERKANFEKLQENKKALREQIKKEQLIFWKQFNDCPLDKLDEKKAFADILNVLMIAEIALEKGETCCEVAGKSCTVKSVADKVKVVNKLIRQVNGNIENLSKYRKKKETVATLQVDIDNAQKKYYESIDSLFELFLEDPEFCSKALAKKPISDFDKRIKRRRVDTKVSFTEGEIATILKNHMEFIVESVVNAFAKHYDKTSALDEIFNATRLRTFKDYYKLKSMPGDEIKQFNEMLKKLEDEYTNTASCEIK